MTWHSVPCMNKEMRSSFQNNAQQMKKRLKIICILLPACRENGSVCFQDLPEVPEGEVLLSGETVEEEDSPVVGAAPKFSVCANCVPFARVAGNERVVQVRGTCTGIVLGPGPSLRQMLGPSQKRLKVRKHYIFWSLPLKEQTIPMELLLLAQQRHLQSTL